MDQQTCRRCGAVGTEHYTYKTKTGLKPLPNCKVCHNEGKYAKKELDGLVSLRKLKSSFARCSPIVEIKSQTSPGPQAFRRPILVVGFQMGL